MVTRESAHLATTDELDRLGRMVSLGALGGGIANRLVMRILALVNSDKAGLITENGNVSGVGGGLIYIMIRRWLPDYWPVKGPAFGFCCSVYLVA